MTMESSMFVEGLFILKARDRYKFPIDILKYIYCRYIINTRVKEKNLSYLRLAKVTTIDIIRRYIQLKG